MDHGRALVFGLLHNLAIGGPIGRDLGDETGAQGMTTVFFGIPQASAAHQPLHDSSNRIFVERVAHLAMPSNSPQDIAFRDARNLQPIVESENSAGLIMDPVENVDLSALPFLVGLRLRNMEGVRPCDGDGRARPAGRLARRGAGCRQMARVRAVVLIR